MKSAALIYLIFFLPSLGGAQTSQPVQTPLPFNNATLQNFTIPSCRVGGCNRQIVDPNRAVERWGSDFGEGRRWVQRVRADAAYTRDGQADTTCSGAVHALFKLVCQDSSDCDIEARYEDKCLDASTDARTAEACANVIDSYVQQCFGNGCPREVEGIVGGALLDQDRRPFCSGTGFGFAPSNSYRATQMVVTVDHCETKIKRGTDILRYSPPAIDHLGDRVSSSDLDIFGKSIRAYTVEGRGRYPIGVGRPVAFAKTYFQGYNSLIASYRRLLERTGNARTKYSPLFCDSSSLCTIVKVEDGRLLHTCQSTKGGSGGALVQEIDGVRRIVGINNGSPSRGEVSENDGFQILK